MCTAFIKKSMCTAASGFWNTAAQLLCAKKVTLGFGEKSICYCLDSGDVLFF